jgi:hypothetical protein
MKVDQVDLQTKTGKTLMRNISVVLGVAEAASHLSFQAIPKPRSCKEQGER